MFLPTAVTEALKQIYQNLQDQISRDIFLCRMLYFLTGDIQHILEMNCLVDAFERESVAGYSARPRPFTRLCAPLSPEQESRPSVVFYGAGDVGNTSATFLESIGRNGIIQCYCDANPAKQGQTLHGRPIISPVQALREFPDHGYVIATNNYQDEILGFLLESGVPMERIYRTSALTPEYFGLPFLPPISGEIYVDAGGFDGDTILAFRSWCANYQKIYAIEPDPSSCGKLRASVEGFESISIIQKAVWSHDTTLAFNGAGVGGSRVAADGSIEVEAASIDSIVGSDKVTLIKMDIEGAEMAALEGARNTIISNRPRLAVCVYHKPQDILEIPLYLLELAPDYKLYIRHHSLRAYSTVLYAV